MKQMTSKKNEIQFINYLLPYRDWFSSRGYIERIMKQYCFT
jgi:hypothetical protein